MVRSMESTTELAGRSTTWSETAGGVRRTHTGGCAGQHASRNFPASFNSSRRLGRRSERARRGPGAAEGAHRGGAEELRRAATSFRTGAMISSRLFSFLRSGHAREREARQTERERAPRKATSSASSAAPAFRFIILGDTLTRTARHAPRTAVSKSAAKARVRGAPHAAQASRWVLSMLALPRRDAAPASQRKHGRGSRKTATASIFLRDQGWTRAPPAVRERQSLAARPPKQSCT